MSPIEVEVKSLLGSKGRAEEVRKKLLEKIPALEKKKESSQLNHYFNEPTNRAEFLRSTLPLFNEEEKKQLLEKIIKEGKSLSVRTRQKGKNVFFIVKASIGDDTSSNGVSRIEFEEEVAKTLMELDQILLDAGLTYQAKWSREREEYESKDHNMHITIDKNAGYGYLSEFEKTVFSPEEVQKAEEEIRQFMSELGIDELPQDRLERMFQFYNENWQDYYGTDKVFNIE